MLTIKFETKLLKAALTCAPSKDVRYYLNGVWFDSSINSLISSTGTVLFIGKPNYIAQDGPTENVWLPYDLCKKLLSECGKQEIITLEVTPDTIGTATSVYKRSMDSRLIDWRRVYPSKITNEVGYFDPALIGDTLSAAVKALKVKNPTLFQNGPANASVAVLGDYAHLVIMPWKQPIKSFERYDV